MPDLDFFRRELARLAEVNRRSDPELLSIPKGKYRVFLYKPHPGGREIVGDFDRSEAEKMVREDKRFTQPGLDDYYYVAYDDQGMEVYS